MLNRDRLALALTHRADKIFTQSSTHFDLTTEDWKSIVSHHIFLNRIAALRETYSLVSWHGQLSDTFPIMPMSLYHILAVDGSQIYPDRHVGGVQCSLINIGGCSIDYASKSTASFFSYPTVIVPEDFGALGFTSELIDLEREAREFTSGLEIASSIDRTSKPLLILFDGSLIFWHLENKTPEIKTNFLNRYCQTLTEAHNKNLLMASYISMPKGKELAQLLAYGLCNAAHADAYPCPTEYAVLCTNADSLIDAMLVSAFLPPHHRTTIMKSNAPITKGYPESIHPCFFYMNVGKEIVRIEIPSWIARDKQLVEKISSICLDQALKGRGYPVTLAEAHEQAVIKGPDRDFFYHLIQKIGFDHEQTIVMSQKSIKKRGIGV